MRITKMGNHPEKDFIEARKIANEGCHLCPCCQRYVAHPIAYRNVTYAHRVDLYRCSDCGCEWESELYPFTTPHHSNMFDYPINQVLSNINITSMNFDITKEKHLALLIDWSVLSTTIRGTAIVTIISADNPQLSYTPNSKVPAKYRKVIGQAILSRLITQVAIE